ncbi:MAG: hypothetical protein ABWX92_04435 [Mycetocola sp.]
MAFTNSELSDLCARFLEVDRDARGWASLYPDESEWESPDCDEMSERFLRFAHVAGVPGFLVRAESIDEGQHWFAVVQLPGSEQPLAVDWTARQFHNAGFPLPPTDPALIPCPLVFEWPGRYPLDVVEFQSLTPSEAPLRST